MPRKICHTLEFNLRIFQLCINTSFLLDLSLFPTPPLILCLLFLCCYYPSSGFSPSHVSPQSFVVYTSAPILDPTLNPAPAPASAPFYTPAPTPHSCSSYCSHLYSISCFYSFSYSNPYVTGEQDDHQREPSWLGTFRHLHGINQLSPTYLASWHSGKASWTCVASPWTIPLLVGWHTASTPNIHT